MIKRASFSDLTPGMKLLVHPSQSGDVRDALIGRVLDVDVVHEAVVTFTCGVWTTDEHVPSTYILYDELTEHEKFIMALKGEIIDNCENGGTVDTLP